LQIVKVLKLGFFSLLANIARIGLSFIAGIIIARSLGPEGYGNYNFLLGSFVSIITLFDMGASPSAMIPGLGLASIGLALKMVILNMIGVNIFSYFICKLSKWKFDILYQFTTIGLLLIISFTIKVILSWCLNLINISLYPLVFIILCLPIYILIAGVIVYLFPKIIGIEKEELINILYGFKKIFHKI